MSVSQRHYLVIRLSAMGDVVLAAQVIRQVLDTHPDIVLHVLTRKVFQAFFKGVERIHFIEPDLYGRHKGFIGLNRLAKEIRKNNPIVGVIDLHDVLRSQIVRTHFRFSGIQTVSINKDRKARKALTQKKNKDRTPLKSIIARMTDTFAEAGLVTPIDYTQSYASDYQETIEISEGFTVGIAPSASTRTKTYPLHLMQEVVRQLLQKHIHVYVMGGGKVDQAIFKDWAKTFQSSYLHNGMLSEIESELSLIGQMDLMLTMDSSNMHMARLVGTDVVSIWGATHPDGGYAPFGVTDPHTFIQRSIKDVSCRPCSIFGQKDCFRDKMYCLEEIKPSEVVERVLELLSK